MTTFNVLPILSLFSHGSGCGLFFFSVATPKSKQSLLHFTTGESVVTGDCLLNLSGSAIKLISLIISSAVKKGYKSPPHSMSNTFTHTCLCFSLLMHVCISSPTSSHAIKLTSRDSFFMCTDVT